MDPAVLKLLLLMLHFVLKINYITDRLLVQLQEKYDTAIALSEKELLLVVAPDDITTLVNEYRNLTSKVLSYGTIKPQHYAIRRLILAISHTVENTFVLDARLATWMGLSHIAPLLSMTFKLCKEDLTTAGSKVKGVSWSDIDAEATLYIVPKLRYAPFKICDDELYCSPHRWWS